MNYIRPKSRSFYDYEQDATAVDFQPQVQAVPVTASQPVMQYSRAPATDGGQAAYDASQVANAANAGAGAASTGSSILSAIGGGLGAAQLGLGAVGTVANIWSGYQADKTASKALAEDKKRYEYQRKRTERAEGTANRRATKGEVQSDQANAMNAIDWYADKYVRRAG